MKSRSLWAHLVKPSTWSTACTRPECNCRPYIGTSHSMTHLRVTFLKDLNGHSCSIAIGSNMLLYCSFLHVCDCLGMTKNCSQQYFPSVCTMYRPACDLDRSSKPYPRHSPHHVLITFTDTPLLGVSCAKWFLQLQQYSWYVIMKNKNILVPVLAEHVDYRVSIRIKTEKVIRWTTCAGN